MDIRRKPGRPFKVATGVPVRVVTDFPVSLDKLESLRLKIKCILQTVSIVTFGVVLVSAINLLSQFIYCL